ncbi:MAG: carbohydrate ABC transporter permease [Bacilli bacterium]|nr:carbohydrate ABC transporter permease [Bacilli bacterium]MDD4077442.1 carbohydrate ABC transporter permease [Bacilli bacterium]MDD4388128.1 carbohydrate ABC transporter permease [Bacilli bacterium]
MEDKVKHQESVVAALKREELKWIKEKYRKRSRRKVRLSRSWQGDVFVIMVLVLFGAFSAYPLVFTIANSLKPLDEIFKFPPRLFPQHITFEHFVDLFNLIGNTQIPISRYLLNTILITLLGTIGHVFLASLCAYPLAKHKFPGKHLINQMVVYSLMFSAAVTMIPTYMISSWLGLIDSQLAIIIPAFGFSLGIFLMRQFINTIPDELLEAAKVDGANEYQIFFRIVMPLVKPAWLTLIILLFQQLWGTDGGNYIFTENLKPLSYALRQIVAGGVPRTGTAAAVTVIMLIVPITVFIINQSRVLDTMAHTGLK